MTSARPTTLSTVSYQFVSDWLDALRQLCSDAQLASLLERSHLSISPGYTNDRITLDQIVSLYQLAAVETGDEMMGLWSRPVRPRALQHLLTSVREATTLSSALYRFSTFWNLLLDDYEMHLAETDDVLTLALHPRGDAKVQRFGHMLILKLAHGLVSWMAGHEVPVKHVGFAFARPEFDQDYAIIFPAQVSFAMPVTSLTFDTEKIGRVQVRDRADLDDFLQNAPRDWIFTRSREHTQSLRVRTYLSRTGWDKASLANAADAMNMTPRTLIRRLEADGTSFQSIKDGLRRDIAIRSLRAGQKSIEEIAQDVGFSSAANFHRAFQRWTGNTPRSYRRPRN
ncbi:AraC family transcriptional regulator [Tateyamaria omphalii]|uniref:helix-turn-helix domain-containing protein n=1 Tax=Tateyamaria omphalii TaxID=299262 RepID=UPI00167B773E|nr:AraC family transcriptional regulator [Tateyamaria omphalii]GGX68086.1 AraC family transcriptional regulator [Tateyamaria omphalii]